MFDRRLKLGGEVRPYFGGRGLVKRPAKPIESPPPKAAIVAETTPPVVAARPAPREPQAPQKVEPKKAPRTMREVVREAASAAGWGLLEMGEDFQIDVRTPGDRSQIVSVTFDHPDREGEPITVFSSICGPLHEPNAAPLLRYNAKLPYGAFAVERMADREEVVMLRATLPSVCTDAGAVGRLIAEIASRADKVEAKLTGRDQF
jgi:hypothetical protein